MRLSQIPLGITVTPARVLAALLLLLAAATAGVAWWNARRLGDGGTPKVDEPLQRLRGFHIFGPDEDDDERPVHVPLIGRRAAAPPRPSVQVTRTVLPPGAPVARTVLPPTLPAPPAPNGNGSGNGHGNGSGEAPKPRPRGGARSNGVRPDIDDQLDRDILLVEDDDSIATMYLMLLDAKGFRTRHARDGLEGIAMVRKDKPALILLDMLMPRMDGLQFLEALRGWPKTSSIPVVVLSNVADHSLVERAMALGAVEYLIKAQTRPQVLVGALPHWLRGNRALTV